MARNYPNAQRSQVNLNLFLFLFFLILIEFTPSIIRTEEFSLQENLEHKINVNMQEPFLNPSDEEIVMRVQSLVDEIFENDSSLFKGITSVMVSRQDIGFFGNGSCTGHILGAFSDGKIIIKESGDETNRRTLYHELGHNFWKKMSAQEKEEWITSFGLSSEFVTPYASTSAEEDFAESFSCIRSNENNCAMLSQSKKEILSRIR